MFTPEILEKINDIVVEAGYKLLMKKYRTAEISRILSSLVDGRAFGFPI